MSGSAKSLADDLRGAVGARMRLAVAYDADDYDVAYVRDDVAAAYTEEEFDEHIKEFVMKGYDDAPRQPEFTRFGRLDATVRWFEDVVAVHVPTGEWDGYLFTFERDSVDHRGGFTETLLEFVAEAVRQDDAGDVDESIADHFD